ncbi:DUF3617 domain-containing protein [Phenylobacterium sp.]|uniref:DUF3617 domain-containing protein n=1 Tax=Phenylobacterium sp. TaxID=1871053 RepID=UPI0037C61371
MRTAVLGLMILTTGATPVRSAPAIQPGYWESTNRLLSPIHQTSTEKRCITATDVEKFMAGPSNRHYACTYPGRVIAGGKIRLKGVCVSKTGQKVAVQGAGAYTPISFTLTADIATVFLGLNIVGRATTDARRIGDVCPVAP